ncbi:MAG: TetR/AcrR family transcriptional regulator [Halioglobus sp.]
MARGRPRKFDEELALTGAMTLFWEKGLAATSLDDLAIAMRMNRPSIYNAFGNKEAIYRRSLEHYRTQLEQSMLGMFQSGKSLQAGLYAFFDQAIEVYFGNNPPLGCLAICTAPSAAVSHPEVGKDLKALIALLDTRFAERLLKAKDEGDLPAKAQPKLAAQMLQATLQSIAVRARSGESKASLRTLARYSIDSILSSEGTNP